MAHLSYHWWITLGAIIAYTHGQQCNFQQQDCNCDENSNTCVFNLVIEQIQTFASYQVENNNIDNLDYQSRGKSGGTYYIDANGSLTNTIFSLSDRTGKCIKIQNEKFSDNNCSIPMTVDGKTFRSALTVNGLIPGPNLIVYEGQTIVAKVTNMLSSDTTSIHWHGMHQRNTPWMDGVGGLSHCPINPGTTFTYIFKASPSGTFWYHSHSGTQRTDGLFGALIVKEKVTPDFTNYFFQLSNDEFYLSLIDWQLQPSEDLFAQLEGSIGFFPGLPIGQIPQFGSQWRTYAADGSEVGPFPYWSGLINGRGRHANVSYSQSRLTIFNVDNGISSSGDVRYRFRMIGAQSLYAYRFSISDHKLTIIAMDGYLVQPMDVDYIIIHSGERYDFALKPKNRTEVGSKRDYLIRAETLEVDNTKSAPYTSLNHIVEAILHYGTNSDQPSSSMYSSIAQSYNLNCTRTSNCTVLNCPFVNYNLNYNISQCLKLTDLQLLLPTPDNELPAKPNQTIFFNFGFFGDGSSSAINGRNFMLPSMPPQTQGVSTTEKCQVGPGVSCSTSSTNCRCTHIVDIAESNAYVEFVFSAVGVGSVGNGGAGHPVHLHGHSFHVVDIGYGTYNSTTGIVNGTNSDISCTSDERCSSPGWANGVASSKDFNVTKYTIRKDTIIVPAGGYVRVWIVVDNPGYWFLHCHIEPHQMEGMAVVINELPSKQNCPPSELTLKCNDFNWNVDSFNAKVLNPQPCSTPTPSPPSPSSCDAVTPAGIATIALGVMCLKILTA